MVQQYRGNQAKATASAVPPTPTVPTVVAGAPVPSAVMDFFKPTNTENLLSAVPMPPHMGPMVPESRSAGQHVAGGPALPPGAAMSPEAWWQAAAQAGFQPPR